MSQRTEFISLVKTDGVSVSELARRFGISRKTAYKWLARQAAGASMSDLYFAHHHLDVIDMHLTE